MRILLIGMLVIGVAPAYLAADSVPRRVLVLDFENASKDKNYEYLKESLADNLKTELIKTKRFLILDQRSLASLKPGAPTSGLSVEKASVLARETNCEAVVIGKFMTAGKRIRINAQAIDALTGQVVAAEKGDGSITSEVFQTIDAVVQPLAAGMAANLGAVSADQLQRREELEAKITAMSGGNASEPAERQRNTRFTLHTLGFYSASLPKLSTYTNGGYGGTLDASYHLWKYVYPYVQGGARYAPGKGTVVSIFYYFGEAGLAHPFNLSRRFTLSPFLAGGVHGGTLTKTQTHKFLQLSLASGVHADYALTPLISLTLATSFTYISDPDVFMPFVNIAAGLGWRF